MWLKSTDNIKKKNQNFRDKNENRTNLEDVTKIYHSFLYKITYIRIDHNILVKVLPDII